MFHPNDSGTLHMQHHNIYSPTHSDVTLVLNCRLQMARQLDCNITYIKKLYFIFPKQTHFKDFNT